MLVVLKVSVPAANNVPPTEASYQSIVSLFPATADNDTTPLPHLEASVPTGCVGSGFTVTTAVPLLSPLSAVQLASDKAVTV